jgi:hypothetical protein
MTPSGLKWLIATLATAIVVAQGCSADGGGPPPDRRNGTGSNANGGSGNGNGNGGSGLVTFDPDASAAGGGDGCPSYSLTWEPKTPTVLVLVDRSDTMFYSIPGASTTYWDAMRTATLSVMQDLQNDVRFGFAAFSGQNATCPDLPNVPPGSGNYDQIASLYNGLGQSQYKNTPVILALDAAAGFLWNDTVNGGKYILLVTDSEFDYCNDPPVDCAPDSAIFHLQQLYLGRDNAGATHAPIGTLVFGIGSAATQAIAEKVLQGLANAGAGQPAAAYQDNSNLYWNCQGESAWAADLARAGKTGAPGVTIVDYAAVGGTAPVYKPNPADQAALTDALRSALAGVKSCTFDLTNTNIRGRSRA